MAETTTMVIINPAVSSLEIERLFRFTMGSKLLFGLSFGILPSNNRLNSHGSWITIPGAGHVSLKFYFSSFLKIKKVTPPFFRERWPMTDLL